MYDWVNGAPKRKSIEAAKQLLAEAGYPNGVDAQTHQPLVINLDTTASGVGSKARLDWLRKQFDKINVQLVVRSTDYNRFQDKIRKGDTQMFYFGWNADYPDPENFLFLLHGAQAKVGKDGENAANYSNPEYDRLFEQMKNMENSPARQVIIDQMLEILRRDSPWLWGFHPKNYVLQHGWLHNVKASVMANNRLKYWRVDAQQRDRLRRAWNQPAYWPLWLGVTASRRFLRPSGFRWVRMAFLVSLALPLNAIRAVLANRFEYLRSPLFNLLGTRGVLLLGAGLGAAVALLIATRYRPASHIAAGILVLFVPLVPLTFAQAIWKAAHYNDAEFRAGALAPPIADAKKLPRVLWAICDEWDFALTFVDRDPALALPNIDRLRAEVLFASNARPPGPETPVSIPAYLTGRQVGFVWYQGPSELLVRFRDAEPPELLGRQPTVFSRVRSLGLNIGVVGWFHPYCRLFPNDLVSCDWWEMAMQHNSRGRTFWPALPEQAESLFETTLLSLFGQSRPVKQQIETYHAILANAEKLANDHEFQFVYVHFPVPHAPHGYNRKTARFDLANSPIRGYIDSLALVDRMLGELRQSMEGTGTWDETAVLITSDHPYREAAQINGRSDPRIPFFFKPAGQARGRAYEAPFNTVLTQDLLLAVLRGEVADVDSAARWLDANRSRVPVD